MAKVIRVYGKADSYDIEFTPNGDKWEVDIPPDMTDGVYAVQLTAIDELGECAYWVGELYMVDGVCCFKFSELPYKTKIVVKAYETEFDVNSYSVSFSSSLYETEFEQNFNVRIFEKKHSKANYQTIFVPTLKTDEAATRQNVRTEAKEINIKREIIAMIIDILANKFNFTSQLIFLLSSM